MILAHLHDLQLEIDRYLVGRLKSAAVTGPRTGPAGQVSASIPVIGLPGDPIPAAQLRNRHPVRSASNGISKRISAMVTTFNATTNLLTEAQKSKACGIHPWWCHKSPERCHQCLQNDP